MRSYFQRLIHQTGITIGSEERKGPPGPLRAEETAAAAANAPLFSTQEISETRMITPEPQIKTKPILPQDQPPPAQLDGFDNPEEKIAAIENRATETVSAENNSVEIPISPEDHTPVTAQKNQQRIRAELLTTRSQAPQAQEPNQQARREIDQPVSFTAEENISQDSHPKPEPAMIEPGWVDVYSQVRKWVSETPDPVEIHQTKQPDQPDPLDSAASHQEILNPDSPALEQAQKIVALPARTKPHQQRLENEPEEFQVSIGTINLTIEEVPQPIQPPSPTQPQQARPSPPTQRSRLNRYYLRNR
jgi:hypothetical protein